MPFGLHSIASTMIGGDAWVARSAIAARSAHALIHPETPLHFEYSTTQGIPNS